MVRSSLSILEDFYGQALDEELLRVIARTPVEQLHELARRVSDTHRGIELRLHTPSSVPDAGTQKAGPEAPYFLHDKTYFAGGSEYALSEAPDLKHLLLYCDKLLLPDLFTDWAEETIEVLEWYVQSGVFREEEFAWVARDAAAAARQLLPLRELLAREQLTLVGTSKTFSSRTRIEHGRFERYPLYGYLSEAYEGRRVNALPDVWQRDPYLAWIVVHQVGIMPEWELEARGLKDLPDVLEASEYISENLDRHGRFVGYGGPSGKRVNRSELLNAYAANGLAPDNLIRAVQFSALTHDLNVGPVVSDPHTHTHLLRSSRILLGMEPQASGGFKGRAPDLSVPLRYQVPSVAEVPLADLVRLRLNEELYAEVRESLTEMAEAVERSGVTGDYFRYQRVVAEIAEATVRPTYERLTKEVRRATWAAKIGGLLAAGAIRLGFTGLATAVGGPAGAASKPIGNASANLAKKAVEKRGARKGHDKKIATSLLVSLLDPVSSPQDWGYDPT